MEQGMIALGFAVALGLAMVAVILSDAIRYTIPNWLNGVILALYLPAAFLLPVDVLPALAAAGIVLVLGLGLFALGLMGGGDVKLIFALTLWAGWGQPALQFIFMTAVMGGLLVVLVLMLRALFPPFMTKKDPNRVLPRLLTRKQPVPYGLAIAAAFLWLLFINAIPMLATPMLAAAQSTMVPVPEQVTGDSPVLEVR